MPRWKTSTRSDTSATPSCSSGGRAAQKRFINAVSMFDQFTSTGMVNCTGQSPNELA